MLLDGWPTSELLTRAHLVAFDVRVSKAPGLLDMEKSSITLGVLDGSLIRGEA